MVYKKTMTFILTLIYIILYYIRPFEFSSYFNEVPMILLVGIVGAIFLLFDVLLGNIKLFKNSTDIMMLGFVISLALSHIRHMWFGGAVESIIKFAPSFLGYFLVTHSIKTEQHLKILIRTLILLTLFLSFEGIMEVHYGKSYFGIEPTVEYSVDVDGERIEIERIKWLGPFADPNDLALALVVCVPFLLNKVNRKRYLIIVVLCIILYAIVLTNSRGGMLALIVSILTYYIAKKNNLKGVGLGILFVAILIIIGPSRIGDVSVSGESAYGRVDAWYEGIQIFKEYPFLGSGMGTFVDYHEITAHNSFVLVLAELGFIGFFFFIGMFYFPIKRGYSYLFKMDRSQFDDKSVNLHSAIYGSIIGLIVAMYFLSRSYILLPFMMIGVASASQEILCNKYVHDNISCLSDGQHMRNIFISSVVFIILIYLMTITML